jgi:hypothetical protein
VLADEPLKGGVGPLRRIELPTSALPKTGIDRATCEVAFPSLAAGPLNRPNGRRKKVSPAINR